MTTAPAFQRPHDVWLSYADMAVRTALDVFGRRLLRKAGRAVRNNDNHLRALGTERWYQHIPHHGVDVDELLVGALRFFDETAPLADQRTAECIRDAVHTYLRTVIAAGLDHDRNKLAELIRDAGCLEDAPAA